MYFPVQILYPALLPALSWNYMVKTTASLLRCSSGYEPSLLNMDVLFLVGTCLKSVQTTHFCVLKPYLLFLESQIQDVYN